MIIDLLWVILGGDLFFPSAFTIILWRRENQAPTLRSLKTILTSSTCNTLFIHTLILEIWTLIFFVFHTNTDLLNTTSTYIFIISFVHSISLFNTNGICLFEKWQKITVNIITTLIIENKEFCCKYQWSMFIRPLNFTSFCFLRCLYVCSGHILQLKNACYFNGIT